MIVDIIVGSILLISSIIAFIRGFIREVLTIFGVVGGMIASYIAGGTFSDAVEKWITPETSNFELEQQEAPKLFDLIPYPIAADILGYGGVFIVVVGVLSVISHFLSEFLRKLGLGAVDRSLGVVFGIVRGIILLGLLYLPVYMLVDAETKTRWFSNSRSFVYLEKTSEVIAGFLPSSDEEGKEEGMKSKLAEEGKMIEDLFKTRETLQKLDVLKSDDAAPAATTNTQSPATPGYDEGFRQEMDQLIQDQADPARPLNP